MDEPLLSLCMIVKNEEDHLARCLESARDVADEIIVVDTGSSDRSVEIARSFGARVFHYAWAGDFGAARNFSLEQARGAWILYLDADEALVADDIPHLRPLLTRSEADGYFVRCINHIGEGFGASAVVHPQFRLFRNRPQYRFRGAIHEQILSVVVADGGRVEAAPIRINHYGYLRRATFDKDKSRRNIGIIEGRLAEDPENSFMRFSLGMEFMRLGEFDRAIAEYRRSFQNLQGVDEGYSAALIRNIGACLLQLKRFDELVRVVDDALDVYPDYTDLVYLRGLAHFQQQKYGEAIRDFRRCLEMGDAGHPYIAEVGVGGLRAWLALGQVYERLGDDHNAVRAYTYAIRKDPRSPLAVQHLGLLLLGREPAEAVRDFFARHVDLASTDVLEALAAVFAASGRYREAAAYLDEAIAQAGPSGRRLLNKGGCLLMLGRFAEAREALASIPPGGENGAAGRVETGFCLLLEGRVGEAEAILASAAAEGRFRPESLVLLALGDLLEGRTPRSLHVGDEDEWARFEAAVWLVLSRLLQLGAFERFEKALGLLALVPRPEADKRLALGKLYHALGFRESAFEELAGALAAGTYDHDSLVLLGGMCAERGQLEDAELLYWRCLGLDRGRLATYTALTRVLVEQGKMVEARQVVLMGKREFPGSEILEALEGGVRLAVG